MSQLLKVFEILTIRDYNVIKRYKRKQIGRKYKLFRKDLLVVRQDKCFGILWSIHVEKGHAGRNIMLKEIKSRGYGGLSNDVPNECYDLLIVDLQELLLDQLF
ncbi:hypothetical protein M3Y96_00924200 [Aphelenchoides besseyi]|nr:hypothetical protein M3Y96_00924200 [Aphelenchoides besseyi]